MYRVLISSPHIGSYSAMLLLGFVFGWWLARWRAKREGMAPRHIDNLALLIAVVSLFGARLFSWWFYFPPGYSFWTAMTMGGGGMVFYGGLIFGFVCLIAYAGMTRISLRELFDAFAPSAALGLAFGRVGCFMAGCCWGDLCVDRDAVHVHDPRLQYQLSTVPAISGAHFPLAVTFPREAGAYEQHSKLGLVPPRPPVRCLFTRCSCMRRCWRWRWRFICTAVFATANGRAKSVSSSSSATRLFVSESSSSARTTCRSIGA